MTSELEDEIKRLPAGVAMLVSNEIERPVTVNIRPRRSRHGGVSTEIISKERAKAATPAEAPEKRSRSRAPEAPEKERPGQSKKSRSSGGLLKKVFGRA